MGMSTPLCIAIASGKGGTGKTTVATNLARVAADQGMEVSYIDCDVEEPNGHIFLKPEIEKTTIVTTPVPVVDDSKCNACGKCRDICQYSAIILLKDMVLAFPNLCHGCGGCKLVCPTGAISESGREVGVIEEGRSGGVRFVHGELKVGEAMSPPLIRKVKEMIPDTGISIIDAPPGTSCPVIQAVKDADFVLLVTEPTPFGLNDLKLAVEMLRVMKLPFGVVVNRADVGDEAVFDYCSSQSIDVLLRIPDDRRIAEAYSRGKLAVEALPEYAEAFGSLIKAITTGKKGEACSASDACG
jgi:MinD superfamily P-loop ATPase